MSKKITKAVITAGGLGTRFLPATKSIPKEMLPIIDKPIIHYLVEELALSGIKEVIIITRPGFSTFNEYFKEEKELIKKLQKSGKKELANTLKSITKMCKVTLKTQNAELPYGNASPMLAAEEFINKGESFVYMFGDDLTLCKVPATKQMIDVFIKQKAKAVLAVQKVPREEVNLYGVVSYKKNASYKYEIDNLIEKPSVEEAPSQMAQFGRFVFSYDVIEEAKHTTLGKGNELWVADVLNKMAHEGKKVIAQPVKGEWLTTGDPLRFIKTTLKFAVKRPEIKKDLLEFIKEEFK
ncbi:UTP--glucose-1-phosphate uridylyltransferase [candidate division WWE3 bacterium]|uniref:UTP--glucose-1-phosphate uridylyltransferase n=1 Tax=candidate division WWE3 bacterium TaxID=2053526 RepID=A0A7X9HSJ9_UNCKA|nr:UTP--glucose-1-phosphate uridylyltransferase [candidate division WWE3 bacterium]